MKESSLHEESESEIIIILIHGSRDISVFGTGRVLYSPAHAPSPQLAVSDSCPVHCVPPLGGEGLVHVLVRVFVSEGPHAAVQPTHELQEVRPPLTATTFTYHGHSTIQLTFPRIMLL